MTMFGLTIVKESELLELRMHKRMSTELIEPLKPIWNFIAEVRRIAQENQLYANGMKSGIVGVRFLPGYSPFAKHGKKVTG